MIEVLAPGPYATVQDLGRPGYAHLGVPHSGAADVPSLRLANRLVGNAERLAGIELTFGGAWLRFHDGGWAALAGAPVAVTIASGGALGGTLDGKGRGPHEAVRRAGARAGMGVPFWVPAGAELRLGTPAWGLRTYLAVRGGIAAEPVLGSRSTDSLSGLGPEPLRAGALLPVGPARGDTAAGTVTGIVADLAPLPGPRPAVLRVMPGPRDDWFTPDAPQELCGGPYVVSQDSNRVGVRLSGPELVRAKEGELPSEGVVAGAVQVPPSGQPIVFLADHPPTGGYPVIAVVTTADLPVAAQLRPGDEVRFTGRPAR
ncbi:biotin-dependent carboxyltransferase family protein [Nonomuraea diastatica]|uniref:Biotin-dependent carboxyltransferase family protein n=1 Tax=Nonomuraea diastatica TaxID=1848329 RepID=A0A4R4X1D9_9ACTN|nr:biotin-dependent carboxyltransferase family protein [Nonomuraea diastatica]TDD23999.1 biotin-dependent carboxyltransferase family protein [Nonomuraea diastatica]